MSDPTFDSAAQNFDAADSAAFAAIDAMNKSEPTAPVAQTTQTTQASTPAAQTPAATPVATPATPTLASLKDEDLVEVLVGGQPQQMSWKDARSSVMMHADYTRKTQEVASARKELETIYTQMQAKEAQIQEALQNPSIVEAYLQKLRGAQVAADPNITPNELASVQDVRNLLQQEIAKAQSQIDQTLNSKLQELEVTRAASTIRGDLDATVSALTTEYPALKTIPGIEKILYDEVNKMGPSTTQEAKSYFLSAAKTIIESLDKHYVSQQKQSAVQKQALVKQGIEPSGVGILPKAKTYKSFDDAHDDAVSAIDALMRS